MTSTTAMLSFFLRPASASTDLSWDPQEAGHAAELLEQIVKPLLADRLPAACFFWQKNLHEMGGTGFMRLCAAACPASF
jgi:hypothetical protein